MTPAPSQRVRARAPHEEQKPQAQPDVRPQQHALSDYQTLLTTNIAASLSLMLKHLRLACMQKQRQSLADKAVNEHWGPEQYLAELCTMELATREDKRLQRSLIEVTLPPSKQFRDFDFHAMAGVTQQHVKQLINQSDWVQRGENVLLFDASGLGKTHLACSIVYRLVDAGLRVKLMATDLVQSLQRAKAELKLTDLLKRKTIQENGS